MTKRTATSRRPAANKASYAASGVSLKAADELVDFLAKDNKAIGGFAGAFPLKTKGMKKPVLLASTDGVGTKLEIAKKLKKLDTLGIDLVAMVVNDLIVTGAAPLFFLDYYATGKLTKTESQAILKGIQEGCSQAGVPLLGGETAEMPGVYQPGDFDLAGFGIALGDQSKLITGERIKPGDVIIGVASNGLHSNGYSLVRQIVSNKRLSYNRKLNELGGKTLGQILLAPTLIYVNLLQQILKKVKPTGLAHITGGGLPGNVARVLPNNTQAVIQKGSWDVPPVFGYLQRLGDVAEDEMFRVFNMGIGFTIIVRPKHVVACLKAIKKAGHTGWEIGTIEKGKGGVVLQ